MRSRGRVSPPVLWLRALSLFVAIVCTGDAARAENLNPGSFTSLGSLNLGVGSILINTDALTITGAATFSGVLRDQGPMNQNGVSDYGRSIAVFDFSNISLGAGVAVTISGSRPVALLSQGNLSIMQPITLSGGTAAGSLSGSAGPAGGASGGIGGFIGDFGTGPGRGSGSDDKHFDGGGGAFGGPAGAGGFFSVAGLEYGDLLGPLQPGSSGSGGLDVDFGSAGGGGGSGGAIELGAIGAVSLAGGILANGGAGGEGSYYGGGGSGGALRIHGSTIALGATVSARGGNAGFAGGAGGGGRILLAPDSLTVTSLHSMLATLSVNGGTAGVTSREGMAGVITFMPTLTTVAAGQSLNFSVMSAGQIAWNTPRIDLLVRNLTLASGGSASANASYSIHPSGVLSINGTLLLGSTSQSIAALNGSGRVQIGPGASLTVGNNNFSSLFSGTLDGGGSIVKTGSGELTFSNSARISNPITLNGGTMIISFANATFAGVASPLSKPITIWNNSTATFNGDVTTTGTFTVAAGSRAIFNGTLHTSVGTTGSGSVQINGGLVVGTGPASISFGGDVSFGSLSTTRMEIGGVTPGTEKDWIHITGSAGLAGELRVGLIDGFLPAPGDSFDILTFGSRSGDINVFAAPGSTGMGLTKSYIGNTLRVMINPILPGDANYDGVVDNADVGRLALSWRSTGNWTNGDFDGNSFVDLRDLMILATHWMNTAPAAPLSAALEGYGLPMIGLPEPCGSLWITLPCLMAGRYRRSKKGTSRLAQRRNIPKLGVPPNM